MTGARKIIAERMAYSAFTAPHINLSLRVDMTEAIRLRERVLEPIQSSDRAARVLIRPFWRARLPPCCRVIPI